MTKFKKITGIALAGCMALSSLMMTAGAAEVPAKGNTFPIISDSMDIPRDRTSVYTDENMASTAVGNTYESPAFTITQDGMKYWKLWIANNCDSKMTIMLFKDEGEGAGQIFTAYAQPNRNNTIYYYTTSAISGGKNIYLPEMSSGTYHFKITTSSDDIAGKMSFAVADRASDLG